MAKPAPEPRAFVGTSGWNCPDWRDSFDGGVPQRRWLAFCAERFSAIEVNATFYRLQRRETFARWRAETPPGFRFAIKGHRWLTHVRRLADPLPSIRPERSRAEGLGEKLAVVLWQLPADLHRDLDRLADALRLMALLDGSGTRDTDGHARRKTARQAAG